MVPSVLSDLAYETGSKYVKTRQRTKEPYINCFNVCYCACVVVAEVNFNRTSQYIIFDYVLSLTVPVC